MRPSIPSGDRAYHATLVAHARAARTISGLNALGWSLRFRQRVIVGEADPALFTHDDFRESLTGHGLLAAFGRNPRLSAVHVTALFGYATDTVDGDVQKYLIALWDHLPEWHGQLRARPVPAGRARRGPPP